MGRSGLRRIVRSQVSQALCGLLLLQSAPAFADLLATSQERQSWVRLTAGERSLARTVEAREQEAPAPSAPAAAPSRRLARREPAEARPVVLAQAQPSPQQPAFPRDGNGPVAQEEEHGQDTDGQASAPAPGELPPSPPGVKDLRSGVNLAPVTLKAGSTSELVLQSGWNLVSLAKQPGNPAPASVFFGAASRVFAYDACDAADPWKLWDPANPSGSDLSAVSPKLGLWAEAPAAVPLPVAGTEPASTTIHLCTGWNLIGAPFSQDRSVTGALSSIQGKYARVFGYDAADPADPWEVYDVGVPAWANTLQVFEPGKGYWVFATVETDLVLSNDTDGPIVQISVPADLSEVTTLTNVVGTVSGELIQEWHLAYRALGDAQWITIGSGTTPVVNGVLGAFDPTLLLNGPYQLELTATDANNLEQSFRVDIAVEGQQKIGNFTLTYSDLEVPLSGLPIQILRTYDSRDKRQGDFGVGWTLDIRQGSYKNNRQPGEGWQFASGFLPCQFIQESLGHVTTIRLSDREIYRFRLALSNGSPILGGCLARARFDFVDGPVPGATLGILGNNQVIYPNGGNEVLDEISEEIYEPAAVRLTTRDGRIFDLNLQQGVTRLEDTNGNELSITPGGITHSSGRTVTFERDGLRRITRITDPEGESLVYEYDAAGDLVAVTDRSEQTTHFTYNATHGLLDVQSPGTLAPVRNEYDSAGRLLRHVDTFGKTIEFSHDLDARREVITDRLGHSQLFEYDARGNVVRELDGAGREVLRTFDARDNLITETDALGNTTTHEYDSGGYLTSTTDPLGNVTSYTYNSRGQKLTIRDPRGKVTENAYDSAGNLLLNRDPEGAETRYVYDNSGHLMTKTDAEDGVTRFEYDSFGNMTKQVDALGHETTYTYSANGNRLTETRSRTRPDGTSEALTTTFRFDRAGRIVETVDPDGFSTENVYDAAGQITETIDALQRSTLFRYDNLGRLLEIVYPDGTHESRTYDPEDRIATATDRGNRTTAYTYDMSGRPLKTIFADSAFTENGYDAVGRMARVTDARQKVTTYEHDKAGRRIRTTDALGGVSEVGYDPAGNTSSMMNPNGKVIRFEYDGANRLVKTVFPDGTEQRATYDKLGRKVSETDQAQKTTHFGYDAVGRLIAVTDSLQQATRYAYDEVGNRISQTDANNHVTRFEYDKVGHLIRRILPDGTTEEITYDPAGRVTNRKDLGGRTTTYRYDLGSRVIERTDPNGVAVHFTYTLAGRRETAVDSRGTTTYRYDQKDRLVELIYPDGRKLSYGYDANGNRLELAAQIGAEVLKTSYVYDDVNRLVRVIDPKGRAYEHAYDASGNLLSLGYPNEIKTVYELDQLNRLTSLTTSRMAVGEILQSYVYSLGPTGMRTRINEHGGIVRTYAYDDLYRLRGENVSTGNSLVYEKTFSYDPVGNRLSQGHRSANGATTNTTYTYDDRDRVVSQGEETFTWDANGNLTGKGSEASYTWNANERLESAALTDGTVVTYLYDVDGVRVRTTMTSQGGPAEVLDYLVDTSGPLSQVVAETNGNGALATYYVRGNVLLAVLRLAGDRFYHMDGLGSVRVLTDENGNVSDRYSFSAFGELIAHEGTDPNAYLFAGEMLDPNSRFYYLRARWMSSETGSFVSRDLFAGSDFMPQTLHDYQYAHDNPVNLTDPSGLFIGLGTFSFNALSDIEFRTANAQVALAALNQVGRQVLVISLAALAAAVATTPRSPFGGKGYWNDELQKIHDSGLITATFTHMLTLLRKFRDRAKNGRKWNDSHEVELQLPSGPDRTPKETIFSRSISNVTLKIVTGGYEGRIFELTYRIGGADNGLNFFRFRMDWLDHRDPPGIRPHCHVYFAPMWDRIADHLNCLGLNEELPVP